MHVRGYKEEACQLLLGGFVEGSDIDKIAYEISKSCDSGRDYEISRKISEEIS